MSIVINFGAWGGVYVTWGYTKRVCLGWVAITLAPFDMDEAMLKMADLMVAAPIMREFIEGAAHGPYKDSNIKSWMHTLTVRAGAILDEIGDAGGR